MKNEKKMQNPPTQVKPISCPRCGSTELAFVTHYQKELLLRIACLICTIISLFIFIINIAPSAFIPSSSLAPNDTIPFFIFAVLAIVFWIGALIRETETHVQAICKNCGYIWLLN